MFYFIAIPYFLSWLYIFQLKEYRVDRVLDFFRSRKGQVFLLRPDNILFLLLGITMFVPYTPTVNLDYVYNTLFSLIVIYYLLLVFRRKIYRPVATLKATLLYGLFFVVLIVTSIFFMFEDAHIFAVIWTFMPIWMLLIVQIVQIPTMVVKKRFIAKAMNKLSTYKELKVVGITGSYGKTSTKNFLDEILKNKYTVVSTPKNINTEIGVAQFILDHDFTNDDIFIVEMGAYSKGEIKLIADMVKPLIGIITAVGPEHLALFGSIEKIRDTKGELFATLPNNGLAITHADNPHCREIIKSITTRTVTFGTSDVHHPTLLIHNREQTVDGISGIFDILREQIDISSSLYGTHNLNNFAAAYLAAIHLGIDADVISTTVESINPAPHRLEKRDLGNNTVVLDDTYNSNPEGFLEALEVLKLQDQAIKIVITRGMLELGKVSTTEHERIGKKIGAIASQLIIISADNAKALERGAKSVNPSIKVHAIYNMQDVITAYRAIIKQGNVAVLLESKVPDVILNTMSS